MDQARARTPATARSWTGCCATSPGARRRCIARAGCPSGWGGPCTSSARTSTTPARTSSTTRSARRCSPGAWASGGSSPRRAPASTAWRRRPCARCWAWSAWCTWASRTRAASGRTCSGWSCWGRAWSRWTPGAKTLKEATSAAIRDWVTNVQSTHYVIGSVVGPAPYPALVRDLQRVIGDEARAQMLEREGRLPARVIACVGGGSNAIGIFAAFIADEQVELDRRGGRRRGHRDQPARRAADRRRAPRHPARLALGGDAGRGGPDRRRRTRSRPASTTRAPGPSTRTSGTPAARATSR